MLLVMDVGNTCITLGVYRERELLLTARLVTDRDRTEDQYAVELQALLSFRGLSTDGFSGAAVSSVVPILTEPLCRAVEQTLGVTPLVVGSGVKTGLNIQIDDPAQAGADLVCGGVAALALYPLPCIIFDLGTATTISVLGKNGAFLGGTIAAGIGISLDALSARTSQLPHVSLKNPQTVIGRNTVAAMQSGLIYGAASMMDGMIERIEAELGQPAATVVATGGRASEVAPYCKRRVLLNETLLLEGLRLIYERNRKG